MFEFSISATVRDPTRLCAASGLLDCPAAEGADFAGENLDRLPEARSDRRFEVPSKMTLDMNRICRALGFPLFRASYWID